MVDQLCQAYHWSLKDALHITMPQMIMLNHASWVNAKRAGLDRGTSGESAEEEKDPIVHGKKRLSEMTSDDYAGYYGNWT